MAATISQLSQLIAASVTELLETCAKSGLQVPDLNDAYTPESEAFRKNAIAAKAANNIAAAAFQLAACVLPPQESVIQTGSGHFKSAALRVAIECHVPEILREAGGQGLHADDIAVKTGVNGPKLGISVQVSANSLELTQVQQARLLRALANRHIFREVKPDVFVNTRLSGSLDTGKSVETILKNPEAKHDDTSGMAALVEVLVSDCHKGSAYLMENMKDPVTNQSDETHHAPFQRGLGIRQNFWEFLADPDQAYRHRRFGVAMKGSTTLDSPDLLFKLFDWNTLPKDGVVVDVGGGIGSSTKIISKANPNLRFVVQDAPSVAKDGVHYWNQVDPEAIRSGRVQIQAHDFFKPQPITNASMFFLKNVIHDWSDGPNMKLLSQLRKAATPDTVLLVLDTVMMPSTQMQPGIKLETVSESQGFNPPSTLSTGYALANDIAWTYDIAMMVLVNSQEHTIHQFDRLLTSSGWKIVKVVLSGGSIDSVLAKPI